MALNGFESLAQAGRELHTSALQRNGKRTHVYTHQAPLSSYPESPFCPLSPTPVWGYSPWMRGESWEDLLSCSLEWTSSGADSVLLGAARSCKERWMSCSADCLWCVSSDWWVNTAPPAPRVKLMHPCHKTTILSWRSDMLKRKAEEIGNRGFVNWADVGKLAAWESRLHHRVFCCRSSNHRPVSQQLNNQDRGVINAVVGV